MASASASASAPARRERPPADTLFFSGDRWAVLVFPKRNVLAFFPNKVKIKPNGVWKHRPSIVGARRLQNIGKGKLKKDSAGRWSFDWSGKTFIQVEHESAEMTFLSPPSQEFRGQLLVTREADSDDESDDGDAFFDSKAIREKLLAYFNHYMPKAVECYDEDVAWEHVKYHGSILSQEPVLWSMRIDKKNTRDEDIEKLVLDVNEFVAKHKYAYVYWTVTDASDEKWAVEVWCV